MSMSIYLWRVFNSFSQNNQQERNIKAEHRQSTTREKIFGNEIKTVEYSMTKSK